MLEVAVANLNSFAHEVQQTESPVEDIPAFFLTSQDALEDREKLCLIVKAQVNEIEALKTKLEALQKDMDSLAENQLNQLRLIADLRHKEPGKTELSRAEKIEKYLENRPDHKASFETLKGHLGIDNTRLKEAIKILITTSNRAYSIQKEKAGDKRKRILVMLPK